MMGFFQDIADRIAVAYHAYRLTHARDNASAGGAAFALREMRVPAVPAIPALVGALEDNNSYVRYWASTVLGSIADMDPGNAEVAKAVPALIRAIGSGDVGVRRNVASALWRIAKANPETLSDAAPALIRTLRDGDRDLRHWAGVYLADMIEKNCGTPDSVKIFEEKLGEGVLGLRKSVKNGQCGDEAQGAMLNLAKLINKAARKKNELARMEMEAGGLILAGERPKPPKKDGGGMYRSAAKQRCIR